MITQMKGEDETLDTFYHGRISILQKKNGFRFSVDAPLLADFIHTNRSDELLELGTGCGIISLLLSIKPFKHITALEIQDSLAELAKRNVKLNKLEKKITIIQKDMLQYRPQKKFEIIFSNPPYLKLREGHLSATVEKTVAKHELKCDIFGIMQKTEELLKKKGRAYFIFRTKRKEEFIHAAKENGLKIKTMRFVFPRLNSTPNQFLAECDFFAKEKSFLTPLILYDADGKYTPEAQEIFSGRIHAGTT
jgi:tRNA1(Val) A37 N6-methylase TrmN6